MAGGNLGLATNPTPPAASQAGKGLSIQWLRVRVPSPSLNDVPALAAAYTGITRRWPRRRLEKCALDLLSSVRAIPKRGYQSPRIVRFAVGT